MSSYRIIFILFIFYGGLETAGRISCAASFKHAFKISIGVCCSVLVSGILFYPLSSNIRVPLIFMLFPLIYIGCAYFCCRIFSIKVNSLMFSSLSAVLVLNLPAGAAEFFTGLIAGCAGFIVSALMLYRVAGLKDKNTFLALPRLIILASIISMIIEML